MPSNYEQIKNENIRRRGEEFDDIGRLISEHLYSDRTHFIYELLQNAEDALERRFHQNQQSVLPNSVKFKLYKDHLEFRHFAQPFNEKDVRAISDILKGTKEDDKTQIGKFGIGFKSVYAFTAAPEIHSGDENFIIERYIRPKHANSIPKMKDYETLFIFPFNHEKVIQEESFDLIAEKLRKIGPRVLLFLKRIDEISWQIEDQEKGIYLRESDQQGTARHITVAGQNADKDEEEEWLVFERQIQTENPVKSGSIEVAFRMDIDKNTQKKKIIRISSSPLVVYFPTEKETRLGFLIQGPYHTTPGRDNISKDDHTNRELVQETANLLTESLQVLKDMGLLTVSLLETLPIRTGDFPTGSLFRPIYEQVREALRHRSLIPTASGEFVAGINAKLARGGDLVDLISSAQLSELFKQPKLEWITTEITDKKQDLYRYLVGWSPSYEQLELGIEPLVRNLEIRPGTFVEKLRDNLTFLRKQSDDWMIELYLFFSKLRWLWELLKQIPFIRLQDGEHVCPFREKILPNAYLPPEGETDLPTVKREILATEKVRQFLIRFGLQEPDIVDEAIEKVLPKYYANAPKISGDEHQRDVNRILRAYSTDSKEKRKRLKHKLGETAFIHAENPVLQKMAYKKPGTVYYKSEDLLTYFEGNDSIWFVSSEYDKAILKMLKDLGMFESVSVKRKGEDKQGRVIIIKKPKIHERGLNGFDPYIEVEGLETAVTKPRLERSLYIWNNIAIANSACICGVVESSTRMTYENSKMEEKTSEFGSILMNAAWLPDAYGNFHKACDIFPHELPELFRRDDKLSDQLGMKKDVIVQLAEEAGISPATINLAQRLEAQPSDIREKIETMLQKESNRPVFPKRSSANPERREERLVDNLQTSAEKEYEYRKRSVRTSKGSIDPIIWLRSSYTNDSDQMVCQICKNEMPFKKRDEEYYFEHVEIFDRKMLPLENEVQFLALCPLCAAMYKEFIKRDEEAMEQLKLSIISADDLEISLQLGDLRTSISFVDIHINDLRTILREPDNDREV